MLDVKKLIVGFLVIASAAASSAFILSNNNVASQQVLSQNSASAQPTTTLTSGQSAYVPTQSDVVSALAANNATVEQALNDPNNLTTNFTNTFLNTVAAANPSGLQTDSDGNNIVALPTQSAALTAFAQSSAVKNFKFPDVDAEAARLPIIKATSSDSSAILAYEQQLSGLIKTDIVSKNISSILSDDSDLSDLSAASQPIQTALQDSLSVPTPQPFVAFQKSWLKYLVYTKDILATTEEAQTDPMKSVLTLQVEDANYTSVSQSVMTNLQQALALNSIQQINLSYGVTTSATTSTVAWLPSLLGIPVANAQVAAFVQDVGTELNTATLNGTTAGQYAASIAKSIALQVLKNSLTIFLQQRVLKWIAGSGAPRFIQQWGTTLAQAYTQKAIAAMSQVLAQSCQNIGPLLQPIQTNLINSIGGNNKVLSCPIPSASISQLTSFYNNFNAPGLNVTQGGSWGLYADILSPSGNYYGTLLQANDYTSQQAAAAQQAAQLKASANNGYTGDQTCANGADPNNGSTYYCGGIATLSSSTCSDGTAPQLVPNYGMCPVIGTSNLQDAEPYVTTPGQTTLQTQGTALNSGSNLITSANDPAGIIGALLGSFVNTLVSVAANAAVKIGSQGLSGIVLSATGGANNNGIVSTVPPVTVTTVPTNCSPKTSTGIQQFDYTFMAAGADGITYNWSVPTGATIDNQPGPNAINVYFNATGTFQIAVTGSDGKTDTCAVVVTQ